MFALIASTSETNLGVAGPVCSWAACAFPKRKLGFIQIYADFKRHHNIKHAQCQHAQLMTLLVWKVLINRFLKVYAMISLNIWKVRDLS